MTVHSPTHSAATRRRLACALAASLGLATIAIHAQSPIPEPNRSPGSVALPGSPPLAPRPISFTRVPDGVIALVSDREGFVELTAIGPSGFRIAIKSVENVALGPQRAPALFSLVDAPVDPKPAGTGSGALSGARVNQPVLRNSAVPQNIGGSFSETLRKRLKYAGVPGLRTPHAVRVEVEAAGGGARPVAKAFRVVLGPDAGPPVIKFAGGSVAERPAFPPFSTPADNNNGWNIVKTSMQVMIDANNFTVPEGRLDPVFREAYRVIAEYADGTRFAVVYSGAGRSASNPGATRTIATVPNIGRGTFRILLSTPLGTVRDARVFEFPDNRFTTHPQSLCSVNFVGRDVPALTPDEDNFWAPVTFEPRALPASRTCGKVYGEWEAVNIERVSMTPGGVVSAKIVRRPAQRSVAHDGNMPAFTCTAAGLGTVTIHWRANLRIYTGECADQRVP